jgi:prepilin-type processing-associated H-X9-DG protein
MLELLAAIAIIAILASLLIPVVSDVREKSQSTKCLNNMRQIGAALAMYAADNDGYNPPLVDGAGKDWDQGAIFPYLPARMSGNQRQNSVFICPSAVYSGFGNSDLSRTYASTETMIGKDGLGDKDYTIPTRRLSFTNLSGTLILFDGKQKPGNRYCTQVASWGEASGDLTTNLNAPTTFIDYRHDKAFNGLFADGHAETIKRSNASTSVTALMWRGK